MHSISETTSIEIESHHRHHLGGEIESLQTVREVGSDGWQVGSISGSSGQSLENSVYRSSRSGSRVIQQFVRMLISQCTIYQRCILRWDNGRAWPQSAARKRHVGHTNAEEHRAGPTVQRPAFTRRLVAPRWVISAQNSAGGYSGGGAWPAAGSSSDGRGN